MGKYLSEKDKTPHELKSNVVYEYKCSNDKSIQLLDSFGATDWNSERTIRGKIAVSDHIFNYSNC